MTERKRFIIILIVLITLGSMMLSGCGGKVVSIPNYVVMEVKRVEDVKELAYYTYYINSYPYTFVDSFGSYTIGDSLFGFYEPQR